MFRKLVGITCALSVLLTLFVMPVKAVSMESEVLVPQDQVQAVLLADEGTTFSLNSSLPDIPPDNPPFYGACYVTGRTNTGSTVTLYFPNTYKTGYFGVDSNGYLVNVSASSISGYYSVAYNNSVSVSAFDHPRYRNSSSYSEYIDLYIVPTATNMDIETEFSGRVSVDDILPYVYILMLGVILVCFMKRW